MSTSSTPSRGSLITFLDLLVLYAILEYEQGRYPRSITVRRLTERVNELIEEWGIPERFTAKVFQWRVQQSLDRWKRVYAIKATPGKYPRELRHWFEVTGYAHEVMELLGPDWPEWPLEVPTVPRKTGGFALDWLGARK